MKLKEKIYDSIRDMDARELNMLYGHIKLIKMMKSAKPEKKQGGLSIEQIHQMTSCSRSSWADAVVEDREDRL